MGMRKYLYIFVFVFFVLLIGAGCGLKQAEIKSPVSGKEDAPLKIVEWFDFQCPACKNYEDSVMHFVIEDYVKTGKANITYKNLAFIGVESRRAANAALCAHEKGKFDEYYQKLYKNQAGENEGFLTDSRLIAFGNELGIDIKECAEQDKYRGQISKELQEAKSLRVNGTPTLFVNGNKIKLPSSYLSMKQFLDEELSKIKK